MKCKICASATNQIFSKLILKKYTVNYFKCTNCDFVFTENPYWLEESYNNAITKLDIGLLKRNIENTRIVKWIIEKHLNYSGIYLDFAGGYGVFTRLMRDSGYNFFRNDLYCENIFAEYFDESDCLQMKKYDAITAFEVFEHILDPIKQIEELLNKSDVIIFSTELNSFNNNELENWWYMSFETGQHISIYSLNSLKNLAKYFNLNFYTNGHSFHVFSKYPFKVDPFVTYTSWHSSFLSRMAYKLFNFVSLTSRRSLLEDDYKYIKSKIG